MEKIMRKSKSNIKIELNLEDLKSILISNNEVDLDLKNTVIQSFSKKYLKGIIDEMMMSKLKLFIKDTIASTFLEKKNNTYYWNAELTKEVKEKILSFAEKQFDEILSKHLENTYGNLERYLDTKIKAWIKKQDVNIENFVKAYVKVQVEKLTKSLIDKIK